MASRALTPETALEIWTELQCRVSVGAYLELEPDGSYPPDDGTPESTTLESLDNLEAWAARQGLEFAWNTESTVWSVEPMVTHGGVCAVCERTVTVLGSAGMCEGCTMQAAIDAQERYEPHDRTH